MAARELHQLRRCIGRLTSAEGRYYVMCARTGIRPSPVATVRFGTRRLAEKGAKGASDYRNRLRTLDPDLPVYDLVATEAASGSYWLDAAPEHAHAIDGNRSWDPYPKDDRALRIEYFARILDAVFSAVSAGGFDAVEGAVMEAYHETAPRSTTDTLRSALLETLASQCTTRLTPGQRDRLLAQAVAFLPATPNHSEPIAATADWFRTIGFIDGYDLATARSGRDEPTARRITIAGPRLGAVGDRLPIFLLRIELRCRLTAGLSVLDVDRRDERTLEYLIARRDSGSPPVAEPSTEG